MTSAKPSVGWEQAAGKKHSDFKSGLRDGIPICLGYFAVSFAFGILAVDSGCTVLEATLISLTNLTSAGQFAGLTVNAQAGSLLETAVTQFVINARYMLMSIALSQKVDEDVHGIWRWILGYGVTDEIFAAAIQSEGPVRKGYFGGLMLLPVAGWTAGTFLGAFLGNILPEILTNALGVALYGMFIAVFVPKSVEDRHVCITVLLAVAISVLLNFVPAFAGISSGFAIILCAVIASAVGAVFFPVEEAQ